MAASDETCWICLEGSSDTRDTVRPCHCATNVHRDCLKQWRNSGLNPRNFWQCPNCLAHYKFVRPASVDDVEGNAARRRRITSSYQRQILCLWLKMLVAITGTIFLTTMFLYFADSGSKNIPVAAKFCMQGALNGFGHSNASMANESATNVWREDFKRPDVAVWPYYTFFALFLDSICVLLAFSAIGCTFDEHERSTRRSGDHCCRNTNCSGCDTCVCYDPCPRMSGNDCGRGCDGDAAMVLLVIAIIIIVIVIFSALFVIVGAALRKSGQLYDRHVDRIYDSCREDGGELVIADYTDPEATVPDASPTVGSGPTFTPRAAPKQMV